MKKNISQSTLYLFLILLMVVMIIGTVNEGNIIAITSTTILVLFLIYYIVSMRCILSAKDQLVNTQRTINQQQKQALMKMKKANYYLINHLSVDCQLRNNSPLLSCILAINETFFTDEHHQQFDLNIHQVLTILDIAAYSVPFRQVIPFLFAH